MIESWSAVKLFIILSGVTGDVWTQSESGSQEDIISRRLRPDILSVNTTPSRGI